MCISIATSGTAQPFLPPQSTFTTVPHRPHHTTPCDCHISTPLPFNSRRVQQNAFIKAEPFHYKQSSLVSYHRITNLPFARPTCPPAPVSARRVQPAPQGHPSSTHLYSPHVPIAHLRNPSLQHIPCQILPSQDLKTRYCVA
jgi:hypothetical protein